MSSTKHVKPSAKFGSIAEGGVLSLKDDAKTTNRDIYVDTFVELAKSVAKDNATLYLDLRLYPGHIVVRNLCALRCLYISLSAIRGAKKVLFKQAIEKVLRILRFDRQKDTLSELKNR